MLTQEIRKARRHGIGGSDAAGILGVSPYKTPFDIYLSKIEELDDDLDNIHIRVGNKLEPIIREIYREDRGVCIEEPDEMFRHSKHNFILGNVDGLIKHDHGILECKTTSSFCKNKWGDEGTDSIPTEYLIQCAHYAEVLGDSTNYVDIKTCFLTEELKEVIDMTTDIELMKNIVRKYSKTYRYTPLKNLQQKIVEKEIHFWKNHVLKRISPEAVNRKDALRMYPTSSEDAIVASNEHKEYLVKLQEIKSKMSELNQEEESIKTEICKSLGDKSVMFDEDGTRLITWKTQKTNRFDTTSFKEKYEGIYKEFIKTAESRVLRIA